jgi:hypothetical protein
MKYIPNAAPLGITNIHEEQSVNPNQPKYQPDSLSHTIIA